MLNPGRHLRIGPLVYFPSGWRRLPSGSRYLLTSAVTQNGTLGIRPIAGLRRISCTGQTKRAVPTFQNKSFGSAQVSRSPGSTMTPSGRLAPLFLLLAGVQRSKHTAAFIHPKPQTGTVCAAFGLRLSTWEPETGPGHRPRPRPRPRVCFSTVRVNGEPPPPPAVDRRRVAVCLSARRLRPSHASGRRFQLSHRLRKNSRGSSRESCGANRRTRGSVLFF